MIIIHFSLILLISLISASSVWANGITDSVVKIFVTSNSMDYYRPWQSKGIEGSSGSGSIIKDHLILTNAHVIADNTYIQVKRSADSKKYTARVVAIGEDCDLALLTVDDESFFKETKPFEFGELPSMQDAVAVIGFPEGGDKLSITEGVVSRIEVTNYAQSARSLLTVQIDAAVNPGNSGGPVIQNGKIVGVAMQVYEAGQNIGYMIPTPIIDHFFEDLKDKKYDGFPVLGVDFDNTENETLRNYYKISKEEGGVIITTVMPYSAAYGQLQRNDILLAVDNISIGEDGTFLFRDSERLTLPFLISEKQVGQMIDLTIIRDGVKMKKAIKMTPFNNLVPFPFHYKKPPYYIFGGLVFTVLSIDLLQSWGNSWWEKAPSDFMYYLIGAGRINEDAKQEIIVLLSVLSDDINDGYEINTNGVIRSVNGKKFSSFKEFLQLINDMKKKEKSTIFETIHNAQMIIDNTDVDKKTQEIIKRNNILSPYSEDVAQWVTNESAVSEAK